MKLKKRHLSLLLNGIILFFLSVQLACTNVSQPTQTNLNFDAQTEGAQIFAPNLVSTHMAERDAALSPSGNEFFYTISSYIHQVIVFTKKSANGWTEPQVATFSGVYSDLEPHFSPDGNRLYFASNRPLAEGGETKDFDIWYVDRKDNGWSEPINIGKPINTEANEFYPSLTNNSTLYWCSIRNDGIGIGGEDIYYSTLENGKYKTVKALSDSINTPKDEFNAYVARDESYIIFTSSGWGQGIGSGDLWISFKYANGQWTKARNMGEGINSPSFEFCPFVSDCGKYLFFTSNRFNKSSINQPTTYNQILDFSQNPGNKQNNIFIMDASIISELKQKFM